VRGRGDGRAVVKSQLLTASFGALVWDSLEMLAEPPVSGPGKKRPDGPPRR